MTCVSRAHCNMMLFCVMLQCRPGTVKRLFLRFRDTHLTHLFLDTPPRTYETCSNQQASMFGRRQMHSGLPRLRTARFAIAVALASWPAFAQTGAGWITAWGTSQQELGQARMSNATLRLIARV